MKLIYGVDDKKHYATLKIMIIFVTGGARFIGSYWCNLSLNLIIMIQQIYDIFKIKQIINKSVLALFFKEGLRN